MIEDVTTSGKSMEETVPKVRNAADVTIVGLMVSLNRMEVGKGGKNVHWMKLKICTDLTQQRSYPWLMW